MRNTKEFLQIGSFSVMHLSRSLPILFLFSGLKLKLFSGIHLNPSLPPLFLFSGLLPRLLVLPEELVAHRLAVPLLSRFVLLDEAAVTHVVPHLLTPRSGESWLTVEDGFLSTANR